MSIASQALRARDLVAPEEEFATAVLEGFSRPHKALPSRYLYDARGSALFEKITLLPEYYPTRTEIGILKQHAGAMTSAAPPDVVLVEFGSGSSRKTEILLDCLGSRITYVPIDVSEDALLDASDRITSRYRSLDVRAIIADFSGPVRFGSDIASRPKLGFFPGSTIGNLTPPEATGLLSAFKILLGRGSRLLIGVDLKKDHRILLPAYNDADGVTADFNLNLLARINRELGGSFDLSAFRHIAVYNASQGRIEMHLISSSDQVAEVLGHVFHFRSGESIHTENSYKYTVGDFQGLAQAAGWSIPRTWVDRNALFSVHELMAPA